MVNTENILVIDDDPDVLDTVEFCLTDAGYNVSTADDGKKALDMFAKGDFDLVVVDLRLPTVDGLELTREFKEHSDVGIIILSGQGEAIDRIVGLEVGADDYMSKPFEVRELLARVRSVLRRREGPQTGDTLDSLVYKFCGWKINISMRKLTSPDGDETELTSGEFDLLRAFVENPNRVMNREQLLDHTHQTYTPAFDRSVDVQVGRLRKKIEENPKKPQLIKTVRNGGYMFSAELEKS